MPYRGGGSARERAEARLRNVRERLELARAMVEESASGLSDALRQVELCRLRAGAAAASVRHLEAQIASGTGEPDVEAKRAEASARFDQEKAESVNWELAAVVRREELRDARRRMNAAEAERREAEAELARVTS